MKKIIRRIFLLLIALVGIFTQTNSVSAATLDMRYQDDVYYVHVEAGGEHYSSFKLAMYYVDGKLAYCVEPGAMIYSTQYAIGDWSVTSLSPAQRLRIEQIGYFGYEYPGHQNVRYYMAAQELIWQAVKPISASWHTEARGGGATINIDAEKNEIERLIRVNNTKPSFHNETINAVIGDEVILTDTNNVLSNYSIYDRADEDVTVNGNQLKIKVTNTGDKQIRFIINNYDNDVNLVYYNSNSQKMAHTRLSDPLTSVLKLHATAGNVTINKQDKDTKKSEPQGEATLKGAIYDIFNSNDELVTTITTNEEGKVTSGNLPHLGHYYLKERTPSVGYTLDETKYEFDMTMDNLYPTIKVYEKVIEREFDFTKVYANNKTGIMKPEVGIKFGFYNNKNELVKEIKTNDDGFLKVILPYGTYTVKQLTTTKNHEYIEDFTVEVREVGEPIVKVLANAEITAKLHVIKIDSENGKVIKRAGIKFKIYNVDKEEYVCQNVTYPKKEKICTFETDENGEFVTPEILHSGKYKLEELDQKIEGYLWNSESHEFEIGENSELINDNEYGILFDVKFGNDRVKGKITINKVGEVVNLTDKGYEYTTEVLEGIKFGLYTKDGEKVMEGLTDENGILTFENIDLGEYYVKELSTLDGYILDTEKHNINLKYKDQYTPVIEYQTYITNRLPKGTLEFSKTDFSTDAPLPNTKIEIYNEKDELIFTGVTDENGKIVIDKLPIGKYYILEKEAPEGYTLNEERMYFEITEDGQVVKATMKDERIVEVPNTESIKDYKVEILLFTICCLGILVVLFAFKNDKK